MLGETGRDVRCVTCSHMWFQTPEALKQAPVVESQKPAETVAASAPPPAEPPAKSVADALNSILEKDDGAFEAVLSSVTKATKTEEAVVQSAVEPPVVAMPSAEKTEEKKRRVVRKEVTLPVVTHNPMGMGASAFGGMVFLLCSFLTLAVVFMAKSPIVHRWPQTVLLYKTLGFDVKAPGEGLRLSEVTAEKRVDNQSKTLVVEGKMTNMTDHDIAYPPLHVVLKNEHHAIAKEWDFKAGVTQISSGDIVPVMLQLDGAPEDGAAVEIHVKEK